MALSNLNHALGSFWSSASAQIADILTPTVRLGVTGLAGSGKTVFITSLIRNLIGGGRLPFFAAQAEGRMIATYLEPQPDDDVPRFDYEAHLGALGREPPDWPESTRRISELRVALSFLSENPFRRVLGIRRLNVDIVDYPGEWLLDLAMLDLTYAEWSTEALRLAREPARRAAAARWVSFAEALDASGPEDEQKAREGAQLFTAYLLAARKASPLATLGPGRFLLPGDLDGSPLLTFLPLPADAAALSRRGSLGAMMARRFDSYVAHVVRPFFRNHFMRLDRQIVLVDVLGALNGGAETAAELTRALHAVLRAFRPGASSWLSSLAGRRIDRLLFAATKADHIHHTSHDRLAAILKFLTEQAGARASDAGATVKFTALSSIRSTREAAARDGNGELPCIVGVPMPGETVAGKTFDGRAEAVIFPGDLPDDPARAVEAAVRGLREAANFPRFRPPRLGPGALAGETSPPPHIRLDRAIEFLIGDRLT